MVTFVKSSRKVFARPVRMVSHGAVLATVPEFYVMNSSRTGTVMPNRKRVIALHGDATTPLTAVSERFSMTEGYLQFLENNASYFSTTKCFSLTNARPQGVIGSTSSTANAKASQDFYKQVNSLRRSVAGQQFVGELHQTVDLLKHPFREGVGVLKSLLSNRPKDRGSKKKASAVGSQWLQVRFGLLPLIHDIEGILDIAKQQARNSVDVRQYKAFGKDVVSTESPYQSADIYGVNVFGRIIDQQRTDVYYHFGYMHQLVCEQDARFNSYYEGFLNIRDIPATLWEITPWSWFVDYFVNVGSIIEAAFTDLSNLTYICKSEITTYERYVYLDRPVPVAPRYTVQAFSPWQTKASQRTVTRSSTSPGIPPVAFSLPRNKIQLANIAAVLAQQLKG